MTAGLPRRAAAAALDLLFAPRCAGCGGDLAIGAGRLPLCRGCRRAVLAAQRPAAGYCRRCGAEVLPEQETPCLRCRDRELAFLSQEALFDYRGLPQELLQEFKFGGCTGLAVLFAALLARRLAAGYGAAVVVPVPARPRRILRYGYDTVDLLARRLQHVHRLPVRRLLRRRRGREQKGLDFAARAGNLQGRIRLLQPEARPVVLLDDVYTTGATTHECAALLTAAGTPSVRVLTLVRND